MPSKTLTLSIVIPVYNEENYLPACLEAIAGQSVLPDEVIVVDNNSTDRTAEIARSYPFVRLIKEPNQHQSFAQKTGFNAAKSDIIGRIDADSILPISWVKQVKDHFMAHPETVGITGSTQPYDVSVRTVGTKGFEFYINLASRLAGSRMLWGANCAIKRAAWLKVKDQVLTRGDIWEDYDLSFCLAPQGQLRFITGLEIGSSFRAVHQPLIHQTRYQFRAVRTFYFRLGFWRTARMMAVWLTLYLLFIPLMFDKHMLSPLIRALRSDKVRAAAPEVVRIE
ncbi:MAG TPA: glycosyltransferase family 2 protein, partial [Candidatus Saccharimonadales bacterium]|nr:glycosyltransferase family 2 protein [Candidatus Saccharimonadales bacterium]